MEQSLRARREAFARGWRVWVGFGAPEGCHGPDERAGWNCAAATNEAGGARPTRSEAMEAAREWLPEPTEG